MKTEEEIRDRTRQHEDNLRMWEEPYGSLVPTEPDPAERERTRMALRGAIHDLRWLLDECECCAPYRPTWGLIATSNSPGVAPLFRPSG